MTASALFALLLVAPSPRVTIDEKDPAKAQFLKDAFEAVLETPSGREMAERFVVDGPSVTVRWAKLDSSALEYEGIKPVINGLSAYTVYSDTGDVVSVNDRLFKVATPRQVAQDLAHEILGHCYERSLADRAGVGYAYAVTRDNETGASLLGWLVTSELGEKQRDRSPFSYLSNPGAYFDERIYAGADYAAALTAPELPYAQATYEDRARRLRHRAAAWEEESVLDGRQLSWIDHFVEEHRWPRAPFDLLTVELTHMKDEEAPRSKALCERIADTIEQLAISLMESGDDRRMLARAAAHPLMKRWSKEVRERTAALRARFGKAKETQPTLQVRPDGQITQDDLLKMIDEDVKLHAKIGAAPLPEALK